MTCEFKIVSVSVASTYLTARSIYQSIQFCFGFFSFPVTVINFSSEVTVALETIKEPVLLIVRERLAETDVSSAAGDLSSTLLSKILKSIAIFILLVLCFFLTLFGCSGFKLLTNAVQFHLASPHYIIILGNGSAQQKVNKQVKTSLPKHVIMVACHYL